MVHGAERTVLLSPEQRKIRDPEERSLVLRNERESLSDILPHAIQRRIGDMLGTRDQQAQLALSNCEALYSAFAQKLCGRSFESGCTALQPDQAAGAGGFRDCFDLVQLLAGERRTTGDLQTANAAAGSQHVVRHRKLRP